MDNTQRYQQAQKITVLAILVTALLGSIKVIGGFIAHSHALFADGIHSFSDLFVDGMVLFASKYGSQDADESHPYGHQRIETAATLLLSLALIITGSGIAWNALDEWIHAKLVYPDWISLPIIGISIIANELLFHFTHSIGSKIGSPLIMANAWHHRSDAASSVVVLLGLIGSLAGFLYLDLAAAIFVGIMIIKMGCDYAWNSVKELVDTAVDAELLSKIHDIIQEVDGVKKIHQLRSRFMGEDIFIDVHILVPTKISVSEGHYIAQHVHQSLKKQINSVKDVIVHVDPEDDEICSPSLHLPNRATLNQLMSKELRIDFPQILFWNLHYLDGKISLDIACSEEFNQWQALHERVIMTLKLQDDIDEVRLFSLHETLHPKIDLAN